MSGQTRLQATQVIWGFFALTMLFLFASTVIDNAGLSIGHVILGIVIAVAAFVSTGSVWSWGDIKTTEADSVEASSEKIKRSRIDAMLSKMSDDELLALRDRLADHMDDDAAYRLGDDGELVKRR
jgi:hypothetical protein